ncbi:Uncharacterised protein [Legionella steigerwaltii]|uniref:Uncharacterized protein n=1 Tax=Legionella steigerwaltii TaxID=460 RepID=A0A378L6Y2_9GAMM|nr:hypothetical protein [Legionella steigerwaltii]KTD76063.1 hypothetical protein Lstg_2351 [Legionella steigerwaltii]STY22120.1 Uncharacterised protein [Legionella steigerwaltii]
MGDAHDLFQSGFLSIPLDNYQGDKSPVLSKDDLEWLITQLSHFIKNVPNSSDLMQSNFHYWLTYALQCAVNTYDVGAAQQICSLLYQLDNDEDQDRLISIFEQPLGGKFAGQTVAYAWMDNLFSATYDPRNTPAVIAINYIFSHLLEKKGDILSDVVTKNIEEGSEKGKNAILLLARAFANAAAVPGNQNTAELIAELLKAFIKKSPVALSMSLTQEIAYGSFKGKSGVYVLACAIKDAGENNSQLIKLISNILLDVNNILPKDLINALCKAHELGPHKGKNALHIILISLVSAAYINQNSEVVSDLIRIVHQVWKSNSNDQINLALSQTINTGEHANLNGIMMIVRALVAAIDHQLQIAPITDFLIDYIHTDPKELGSSFTHCAPVSTVRDYTFSPLMLLINALKNAKSPDLQKKLRNVINALADSESAVEMLLSLSGDEKSIFIEELVKIYSLTEKQVNWLSETDSEQLKTSSISLDSRFFLEKNSWGKGSHFFLASSAPLDEEKKEVKDETAQYQMYDEGRADCGCCPP